MTKSSHREFDYPLPTSVEIEIDRRGKLAVIAVLAISAWALFLLLAWMAINIV